MQTTYELHSSELNEKFIITIKQLFADKNIQIIVTELDDTAYLSSSTANHEHLMQVIQDIEAGKNLHEIDLEAYT